MRQCFAAEVLSYYIVITVGVACGLLEGAYYSAQITQRGAV